MKRLILGDLHGGVRFLKRAQTLPDYKLLLMGDLVDSFKAPFSNQAECIDITMDLIKQGKADCLLGNHEASYFYPSLRASGWSNTMAEYLQPMEFQILGSFPAYLYFPEHKVLFSHAGLTKQIWDKQGLTFENLDDTLGKWAQDLESPFFHIGRYRGGYNPVGGLLWCDWNVEFEPVPELIQVVGHSASFNASKKLRKVQERVGFLRKNGENWNVDCLHKSNDRHENVLEFDEETGIFTPQKLR